MTVMYLALHCSVRGQGALSVDMAEACLQMGVACVTVLVMP